ncbi:antA/AntB antirepressor family protein [Empedobacter brevis]
MGELIKITVENGNSSVSARELHSFLESKQQFGNWIQNRINEYNFIENEDFEVFNKIIKNSKGGRPTKEYALTMDMAKELAMVERNEKGRQARRYFIACEKRLIEQSDLETNVITIYRKKHQLYQELMVLIKANLFRSDITNLCKDNDIPRYKVRHVMDCTTFHPNIVKILYDKAMMNKRSLEEGVQFMIDNLKS